jgi:hypothetical protein
MDTYGSHEGYLYNLHTCSSSEAKRMWKQSIKNQWGNRCAYCLSDKGELTLDHVVPQAKGGSSHTQNVVCCCRSCNASKGHEDWIIWYIQQSFFSEVQRKKIDEWMFPDDSDTIRENLFNYKPRKNVAY